MVTTKDQATVMAWSTYPKAVDENQQQSFLHVLRIFIIMFSSSVESKRVAHHCVSEQQAIGSDAWRLS